MAATRSLNRSVSFSNFHIFDGMHKESQHIEWKESWRDEYLKWICGFANAHGGKIFIGAAMVQSTVQNSMLSIGSL